MPILRFFFHNNIQHSKRKGAGEEKIWGFCDHLPTFSTYITHGYSLQLNYLSWVIIFILYKASHSSDAICNMKTMLQISKMTQNIKYVFCIFEKIIPCWNLSDIYCRFLYIYTYCVEGTQWSAQFLFFFMLVICATALNENLNKLESRETSEIRSLKAVIASILLYCLFTIQLEREILSYNKSVLWLLNLITKQLVLCVHNWTTCKHY